MSKTLKERILKWFQEEPRGGVTRLTIARGISVSKSPYLIEVLTEMHAEGLLDADHTSNGLMGVWRYRLSGDYLYQLVLDGLLKEGSK